MTVDEKGLEALRRANEIMLAETKTEGGLPRVDWYRLRNSIAAALSAAYESARSAEPVASEIGEEIARAIVGPHRPVHASSQWALEELREVRWKQLTSQEQAEALAQARAVLALLQPALERARPAYSIAEPEGGFRAHGSFTPGEKAKLRPIAETLAMLDGNAFFGMAAGDHEDWSDQYLPEAAALYEANGGDGGWGGKASFATAIRKGSGE